jgi:hypothetical protein
MRCAILPEWRTSGYCAELLLAHDLSENRFPLFGIMC